MPRQSIIKRAKKPPKETQTIEETKQVMRKYMKKKGLTRSFGGGFKA